MIVHASLSTVPAWAPIGQYSDWYRAHLGDDVPDILLHPSPLVETLAHHRDRWSHIERFDDFLPFLTFDDFDPDEWAGLALDAGMSYAVFTAKHHDGLCWWDAPNTDRTVLNAGPKRNVLAEFAAACERAEIAFGAYYSLLDWADPRYPGRQYVDDVLHPHVTDLVRRYGARLLWGDGHWGHGESHWRSSELIDSLLRIDPQLAVNDRWWSSRSTFRAFVDQMPHAIQQDPWEFARGIGPSFCLNRNERAEHHMTGSQIVSLLTEVTAKNGHLVLGVGPDASGRIPEVQSRPLRIAGEWVQAHDQLVNCSRPWTTWGDERVRYVVIDHEGRDELRAIDIDGGGCFASVTPASGRVMSVRAIDGGLIRWEQTDAGLAITRLDRTPGGLVEVYGIDIHEPDDDPIELFPRTAARPHDLSPLLVDTKPGDIVQLGDGVYVGPARVPAGVTLRGLGPDRTVIDGMESTAVAVEEGARLEHCTVRGGGDRIVWLPLITVRLVGEHAHMLGCHVEGHVNVEAANTKINACTALGVVASDLDHVTVTRSIFRGMHWDCGVDLAGGSGHVIDSCEFDNHLVAIRLTGTAGALVRGNAISARWCAVELIDTEGSVVLGNAVHNTMRAVDVDGGTLAEVSGNAVGDGDSGCVVQRGASATTVAGNHWERCRVGLFAWDAGDVVHRENVCSDIHEQAVVIGPS